MSYAYYDYDVFVSYSSKDTNKGEWTKTFIDYLKVLINIKGADVNSFYDNEEMRLTGSLSENLTNHVEESALFIMILSKNYLKSNWCISEYKSFIKKYGEQNNRLFVIEKEHIEESLFDGVLSKIKEFKRIKIYEDCWNYVHNTHQLSNSILKELTEILNRGNIIYLAQPKVSSEDHLFRKVSRILKKHDWTVFSTNKENKNALEDDIKQSKLYIQTFYYEEVSDYCIVQYICAKRHNRNIKIWIDGDKDKFIKIQKHEKFKRFLETETIFSNSIDNFIKEVENDLPDKEENKNKNKIPFTINMFKEYINNSKDLLTPFKEYKNNQES